MNRRDLLAGLATAATATLLPATTGPAMADREPAAATDAQGRPLVGRDAWLTLPCPPWCEEDHSPDRLKDDLEERHQERWHTACIGTGEEVCVNLTRTDNLFTGKTSGERIDVGADCEIGPADALLVSRLMLAAVDILAGRTTVARWRSVSGIPHCGPFRSTAR
ncbi:hypothetical protein [Micromonospora aurantiaca (nom. illeg.)]|uniref:hypothetical protein n=1 Tax=Micromonospora aurantiaca (nom. illeg.) TaxID=47850 RepID=UPI001656EB07|nr:hypothetical protein [Micromonospora aurantiaca]MBC9005083.1 hypothetical protein [Micromonospora aurantiaca]